MNLVKRFTELTEGPSERRRPFGTTCTCGPKMESDRGTAFNAANPCQYWHMCNIDTCTLMSSILTHVHLSAMPCQCPILNAVIIPPTVIDTSCACHYSNKTYSSYSTLCCCIPISSSNMPRQERVRMEGQAFQSPALLSRLVQAGRERYGWCFHCGTLRF